MRPVSAVLVGAALALAAACSDSPAPQCERMLPDGVTAGTVVDQPFVCIQMPEPLSSLEAEVIAVGYAAGVSEVIVRVEGVGLGQGPDIVLASQRVPVLTPEGVTDALAVGTWRAHLPILPPAGIQQRGSLVVSAIAPESGAAMASAEVAVDFEELP